MKASANIIGAVLVITLFSLTVGNQYNVSIPSVFWYWVVTTGHQLETEILDSRQSELKTTGNLRFLTNAKIVLIEDLSEIKDMFSNLSSDKSSTPYAPPEKTDANTMPPEKPISVEAHSTTPSPDTESTNPPPTKNPELVGAL